MKMGQANVWIIVGDFGLYTGNWLRRREAIEAHCRELGKPWRLCRRDGDRAVKAIVIWEDPSR